MTEMFIDKKSKKKKVKKEEEDVMMAPVKKEFDLQKIDVAISLMSEYLLNKRNVSDEFFKKIQEPLHDYIYNYSEITDHLFNTTLKLWELSCDCSNGFNIDEDFGLQCQRIMDGYFDQATGSVVTGIYAQRAIYLLYTFRNKYPNKVSTEYVKKLEKVLEMYFS